MNYICKKPLFNDKCSLYTGGISHKEFLLFLNPNKCEVVVFNKCLKKVGSIKTEKYVSITENSEDCYFLLTKQDDFEYLYKATYDFLEFDKIKLSVPAKYKTRINDICFNQDENRIYIVTDNFVYSVTVDGYFIKEEIANANNQTIVRNLNGCCMQPINYNKNIVKYTACGVCVLPYVSYIKNNEAILSSLENNECKIDLCLGENVKVVSMFVCDHKLVLLVIKNDDYNYLYETNIECKTCHDKCLPYCQPLHHCEKRCDDQTACILESIALEQAALSHILNAEGEKIQKAVKCNASICDLLKINESVKDTIFNTTMLEHVLHQKMQSILSHEKNCQCKK